MKKTMLAAGAMCLLMAVNSATADFTNPNTEQILAAANDPSQVEGLLKDASQRQASIVLLAIVQRVQQLEMTTEEKRKRVGELFAAAQKVLKDDSVIVISDVVSRMNPDLMPTVASPGAAIVAEQGLPIALPLAPPVAPPVAATYTGQ
jgi:hypothetical protein